VQNNEPVKFTLGCWTITSRWWWRLLRSTYTWEQSSTSLV